MVASTDLLRRGQPQHVSWPCSECRATQSGLLTRAYQFWQMDNENTTNNDNYSQRILRSRTIRFNSQDSQRDKHTQQVPPRTTSSLNSPVVKPNEDRPHRVTQASTNCLQPDKMRQKWTREEYKEVIEAYYRATIYPSQASATDEMYKVWREKHPTTRMNLDKNKLSNVRRDIIKNNRLTPLELEEIKSTIRQNQPCNSQQDQDATPEVEITGITSANHEDTPSTPEPGLRSDTETMSDHSQVDESGEVNSLIEDIQREWEKVKFETINARQKLMKVKLNRYTKRKLKMTDTAVDVILSRQPGGISVTTINQLIYAAASVVSGRTTTTTGTSKDRYQPKWQSNLERRIEHLRHDLSVAVALANGKRVKNWKVSRLYRKHNLPISTEKSKAKEIIKQKLLALAQRLRRCKKRVKFFRQNKLFNEDAKNFYREIGRKQVEVKTPPGKKDIENFWAKLWEESIEHNTDAEWIQNLELKTGNHQWTPISVTEVTTATSKMGNWKSPGVDEVTNFWLKKLPSTHSHLAAAYNDIIEDPSKIPRWLTEGKTILLPKNSNTADPKNFRPITCLPTMYKALTSILTERLYEYLEQNGGLPPEQKGCRKGSYGCKDQLLINKTITEHSKTKKKHLSAAWIDYKKAYDSVPHSWLLKTLEMHNVDPTIRKFLAQSMKLWRTTLHLEHSNGKIKTRQIKIQRGIFQGDSLSPLLFCLALSPLSKLLKNTNYGYKVSNIKYSHLLYMDDIKLYGNSDSQLEGLLKTVKKFSDDICMNFGLDKCAKVTFKAGKMQQTANIHLDADTTIRELDPGETYRYLGMHESYGIQHDEIKRKLRAEYIRRVRMVTRSELNAVNKIQAINALAIPVISYSFNIIDWQIQELKRLDSKTRKILTLERMHHPKADVHRVYLPRSLGGRGLIGIENAYKTSTIGLAEYLKHTEDDLMSDVYKHDKSKKLYSITKAAAKMKSDLHMPDNDEIHTDALLPILRARNLKIHAKQKQQHQARDLWTGKPLHGKYPERLGDADVDQDGSVAWLKSAGLKAETEGFIMAAQDQSLNTRLYSSKIIGNGNDPLCRLCHQFDESIDHLTSGCPVLAKTEYLYRHDKIATYIHWLLCKKYGIRTEEQWFKHRPETVKENNEVTILWDMSIHTDRELSANRPDIVVKDHQVKSCHLIDISVPSDKNTSLKTSEKLAKYKDLEIEIKRMWKMKTQTVPIIIGALGIVPRTFTHYTSILPIDVSMPEVQKIALLGTAHILRRALSTL